MANLDKLKRGNRVFLSKDNNGFDIKSIEGNVLLPSDSEYFLYFEDVVFRNDGRISGIYKGVAKESMIDGYCREVSYDGYHWKMKNGTLVRHAIMVAVNNMNYVTIILQ